MQLSPSHIEINVRKPDATLADFVESFWMIHNTGNGDHEIVILPDGRFDIICSLTASEPFHIMMMGLGTKPEQNTIAPGTVMFGISFKLLAVEYLLDVKAGSIVNDAHMMPTGFWNIVERDLSNFELFCEKVSPVMRANIKPDTDNRKKKLFDLIYFSNGTMPVSELSDNVGWSSRQINRYFNDQFGISLKAYCNILRFWAALPAIKDGNLFPALNFTDQNHFIKEVKKFAGVVPKELSKNQNDRFILLSALPKK